MVRVGEGPDQQIHHPRVLGSEQPRDVVPNEVFRVIERGVENVEQVLPTAGEVLYVGGESSCGAVAYLGAVVFSGHADEGLHRLGTPELGQRIREHVRLWLRRALQGLDERIERLGSSDLRQCGSGRPLRHKDRPTLFDAAFRHLLVEEESDETLDVSIALQEIDLVIHGGLPPGRQVRG
jgi:hypothetical protein